MRPQIRHGNFCFLSKPRVHDSSNPLHGLPNVRNSGPMQGLLDIQREKHDLIHQRH
jgi:hypothetical protein